MELFSVFEIFSNDYFGGNVNMSKITLVISLEKPCRPMLKFRLLL